MCAILSPWRRVIHNRGGEEGASEAPLPRLMNHSGYPIKTAHANPLPPWNRSLRAKRKLTQNRRGSPGQGLVRFDVHSRKIMKLASVVIIFACFLTSAAHAEEKKLSALFGVKEAVKFVVVEEIPIGDDFGYKETKLKGETKGALAKALKDVSTQSYTTEMNYPFIGVLGRVMLLGDDGKPICTIQVVNWNRTVVFYGVTTKDGKHHIDGRTAILQSEPISRWVYDLVKGKRPEQFKSMQEMYRKSGHTIESLLFGDKAKGEQGAATKPKPKSVVELKSEGRLGIVIAVRARRLVRVGRAQAFC